MIALVVLLVLLAGLGLGYLASRRVPRFRGWASEQLVRFTSVRPFSRGLYHVLIDWCGAECSQVDLVLGKVRSARPEVWVREWRALGEEFEEQAQQAEAAGLRVSARDLYVRACTYYRISDLVLTDDTADKRQAYADCRRAYTRAGAFFDPPLRVVEIPFPYAHDNGSNEPRAMRAYLRMPASHAGNNGAPPPVVVVIPGLSMVKEKGDFPLDELTTRGMATLSIDLPGQGDNRDLLALGPDAHLVALAALRWLRACPDVDGRRIALLGTSTGAALALRAAAEDQGITALVDMAGFCDLQRFFYRLPENIKRCAYYAMKTSDPAVVRRTVAEGSLLSDLHCITCPVLIVHGQQDTIVPFEQGELIAANLRAPHDFWVYPHGDHACTNVPGIYGRVADWLSAHLKDGRSGGGQLRGEQAASHG